MSLDKDALQSVVKKRMELPGRKAAVQGAINLPNNEIFWTP